MTRQYVTSNPNNWDLIWQGSFTAPSPPGGVDELERYYPLDAIPVPVLLDNELIGVSAESSTAKNHWHFAGQIYQRINTGLLGGGTPNAVTSVKRLYLRQITFLKYSLDYGSTYSLLIKIPYWIRQIDLKVWGYIGPVTDSTEDKLTQILNEVQN